jgi:hypothetical protein
MAAALLQDPGDHGLLTDVLVADMLNGYARFSGQCRSLLADAVAQRFGKPGVVEDADVVGLEEPRHPFRVADRRQRPGDHHPVIA